MSATKKKSMARRRVTWAVVNLGMAGAVVWCGFFDGPKAVANLAVFYAWVFLGASLLIRFLFAVLHWALTSANKVEVEVDSTKYNQAKLVESKDRLLGSVAAMEFSIPRWLDRTFDWAIAVTLIAAGWFVTGAVWLVAIWVQHGALKKLDILKALHWQRVEESLGVTL